MSPQLARKIRQNDWLRSEGTFVNAHQSSATIRRDALDFEFYGHKNGL